MKIKLYIGITINLLFWFILGWVLNGVGWNMYFNEGKVIGKLLSVVVFFLMLLTSTLITINVFLVSSKRFISSIITIKNEKGLWKILTLVFRIGMLFFAGLILIFWLIWFIYMIRHGIFGEINYEGGKLDFLDRIALTSFKYISGFNIDDILKSDLLNVSFNLYITLFVFTLIWSATGIAFEIIKKILGGNKPKRNEENDELQSQK